MSRESIKELEKELVFGHERLVFRHGARDGEVADALAVFGLETIGLLFKAYRAVLFVVG